MNRILSLRLRSASNTPLMPSPGRPKIVSTPHASNRSTRTSDASIIETLSRTAAVPFFATIPRTPPARFRVCLGRRPQFCHSITAWILPLPLPLLARPGFPFKCATASMNLRGLFMQHAKVVVVTGASAGLGRAIAHEFASAGLAVGLISRDREALESAAAEIERLGSRAAIFVADVSDDAAVESAATYFEEQLGPIDIWVNNAMVSVFSPIAQMNAQEFRRVTEVNYLGFVHGTLSALKRMVPRNRGRIIQIGSALAYRSIPLQSAYCATKHAIVGFTDSLRCELAHDKSNIKVCVVHMPAMNTPQFTWVKNNLGRKPQPVPPIYQPEVGARMVVHAALTKSPHR